MSDLVFEVPIRTAPGQNVREHWRARAARVKRERESTRRAFPEHYSLPLPLVVRLTRLSPSPRRLDDDNAAGAVKAIRDEVAAMLGVDDADARIRFEVAQERAPWGVRVEIQSRAAGTCLACGQTVTPEDANHAAETRIIAAAEREGHRIPVENLRAFVEDIAQRADRANAKRAGAKVQPTPATYRPGAR